MSSSNNPSQSSTNLGRRKVSLRKIENDRNLQVTFSKRRVGLFKKMSELCTLTGTEAGVVVFSPGNKPHSFGHPNINTISERFLQRNPIPENMSGRSRRAQKQQGPINPIERCDVEYLAQLEKQLEVEKARREDLKKWTPSPAAMGRLSHQQLMVLRGRIMEFGKALENRAMEAAKQQAMPYEALGMARPEKDVFIPYDDSMPVPYDDSTPIPYDHEATGEGEADLVFYPTQQY